MSKTNQIIFVGLLILSWLIFVGLSVEAGGLVVNFFFTLFKPEFVKNLYEKLDLTQVYADSRGVFFLIYGLILSVSLLKAFLFYVVVMLMHKLDMQNPFSLFVSKQILRLSHFTLLIGLFGLVAEGISRRLMDYGFILNHLNRFWSDSKAFILMGAVIYIIATIFRKGVELQTENDLTV